MWVGPPTERMEQSGNVKDRQGRGLGLKKRLRASKLHFCRSIPVQRVSAIRGDGEGGGGMIEVGGI